MTFDSIIEYNTFVSSERPQWDTPTEQTYTDSYKQIAAVISKQGDMAVAALFAVAQDCIKDQGAVCD